MKRIVKFTGVLEYDPKGEDRDPEWCVDFALEHGDMHGGFYLFHTGDITFEDVEGTAGE